MQQGNNNKLPIPSYMAYQLAMNDAVLWRRISFILIILLLVSISSVFFVLPLKTHEVRWLKIGKIDEAMFEVYPANIPKKQKDLLIRKEIIQFVKNALTIDNVSENWRFKKIYSMANEPIYDQLVENYKKVRKGLNKGTRSIKIIYDRHRQDGLKEIEFQTIDKEADQEKISTWEALVEYGFKNIEQQIIGQDELINPLNLHITKYSIRQKNTNKEITYEDM